MMLSFQTCQISAFISSGLLLLVFRRLMSMKWTHKSTPTSEHRLTREQENRIAKTPLHVLRCLSSFFGVPTLHTTCACSMLTCSSHHACEFSHCLFLPVCYPIAQTLPSCNPFVLAPVCSRPLAPVLLRSLCEPLGHIPACDADPVNYGSRSFRLACLERQLWQNLAPAHGILTSHSVTSRLLARCFLYELRKGKSWHCPTS